MLEILTTNKTVRFNLPADQTAAPTIDKAASVALTNPAFVEKAQHISATLANTTPNSGFTPTLSAPTTLASPELAEALVAKLDAINDEEFTSDVVKVLVLKSVRKFLMQQNTLSPNELTPDAMTNHITQWAENLSAQLTALSVDEESISNTIKPLLAEEDGQGEDNEAPPPKRLSSIELFCMLMKMLLKVNESESKLFAKISVASLELTKIQASSYLTEAWKEFGMALGGGAVQGGVALGTLRSHSNALSTERNLMQENRVLLKEKARIDGEVKAQESLRSKVQKRIKPAKEAQTKERLELQEKRDKKLEKQVSKEETKLTEKKEAIQKKYEDEIKEEEETINVLVKDNAELATEIVEIDADTGPRKTEKEEQKATADRAIRENNRTLDAKYAVEVQESTDKLANSIQRLSQVKSEYKSEKQGIYDTRIANVREHEANYGKLLSNREKIPDFVSQEKKMLADKGVNERALLQKEKANKDKLKNAEREVTSFQEKYNSTMSKLAKDKENLAKEVKAQLKVTQKKIDTHYDNEIKARNDTIREKETKIEMHKTKIVNLKTQSNENIEVKDIDSKLEKIQKDREKFNECTASKLEAKKIEQEKNQDPNVTKDEKTIAHHNKQIGDLTEGHQSKMDDISIRRQEAEKTKFFSQQLMQQMAISGAINGVTRVITAQEKQSQTMSSQAAGASEKTAEFSKTSADSAKGLKDQTMELLRQYINGKNDVGSTIAQHIKV